MGNRCGGLGDEMNDQDAPAEQEIDNAIAKAAALIVQLLETQTEAKLARLTGQQALESLGSAVTALIQSRREMIESPAGEPAGVQLGAPADRLRKALSGVSGQDVGTRLHLVR